jgi:hypothetical protein
MTAMAMTLRLISRSSHNARSPFSLTELIRDTREYGGREGGGEGSEYGGSGS